MRICITSLGPNLDSSVDPRFGRAQYFLFLNEEGELEEAAPNSAVAAARGAGIAAAQEVANRQVDIVIAGNVGPNVMNVLLPSGTKFFLSPADVSVKEAFAMWKEGKLSPIENPSVAGGFGFGSGRGRGGGFGLGRGGGLGRGRRNF